LVAQTAETIRESRPRDLRDDAPLQQALGQTAKEIEDLLDGLLSPKPAAGEIARPARLLEAMRYASLGGGKRLRPFLVAETARMFGAGHKNALYVGAALECIHCYSLVHDDLPAMDDDDIRRGRPTLHKAFDDATAILAGDGLLTFAFDILSRPECHRDASVRIALISALSRAAGFGGMAGGQMLDLEAEGRFADGAPPLHDPASVRTLQRMKTGALLHYACLSGALLAQIDDETLASVERYGLAIGEAFQIADDLLDVEGDPAVVGKATGKDDSANKATLVNVLGAPAARQRLEELVTTAERALERFGSAAAMLQATARFIADRKA
jgi:farnesyl diphosphate synthase